MASPQVDNIVDVVVIGAGISGISAAHHLTTICPHLSYLVLDRRQDVGGTWDLFKYPGIRSDSDMYTFGFGWKPWNANMSISPAAEIKKYLKEAIDDGGLGKHFRLGRHIQRASYSPKAAQWTLTAREGEQYVCKFVMMTTGYYDQDHPYLPEFPGSERFRGRTIHPQNWDDSLDYGGKRVVVIGSGATAATLIPAMAQTAAHVTMLQRSPGYFLPGPSAGDGMFNALKPIIGIKAAHSITWYKRVLLGQMIWWACKRWPDTIKEKLIDQIKEHLPDDFDVGTHFTPKYNPWDERICLVPDGDFFLAVTEGRADVVTDHIETFTERGIELKSGRELDADIIVTATGLNMKNNFPMGDITVDVDGAVYVSTETFVYHGCMLTSLPNMSFTMGYANASWTLKADMVSKYVCRLLNHMKANGYVEMCPAPPADNHPDDGKVFFDLNAGYLKRSRDQMPKQLSEPYVITQDQIGDYWRYNWQGWGKELKFRGGAQPMSRM